MGLFERLFPRRLVDQTTGGYLKTLTGYQPVFRSFRGGIYESELCRDSIHAIANQIGKLTPEIFGARQDLRNVLTWQPNPWMNTYQFLYKLATYYETENTAFIIPLYDDYFQRIVGFYPLMPSQAELRENKRGEPCIVFKLGSGEQTAIELNHVGILSKFLYKQDLFGENNAPLLETVDLLSMQKQGMTEGIKQGATIRFLGKLAQALKPADIEAERQRWAKGNLSIDNNNGIALFDAKYSDVKQVTAQPYMVDKDQVNAVEANVFDHFGVTRKILQNEFSSADWNAFYDGKIEPFAMQLSMVITNMLFTSEQKTRGNYVQFSSDRLEYATIEEKLKVITEMTDRAMMTPNTAARIMHLPTWDGGDTYIIRGEYYSASEKILGAASD